jgi:predicted membrane protein
MIISSVLTLMTTTEATTGVLACYVVVLSCLLCCYETHLKQVSKLIALNFGFLYSAKSRSLFMLFVGTILFSFSLFGKIIGAAMLINAGFNMYVVIKHPQYEDVQRRDAQSEIEEFLQSNPALARNAVAIGVQAGADFAVRNPGKLINIIYIVVILH